MPHAKLGIESHVRNGAGTVRLRGEIDLDGVDDLVDAVTSATPRDGRVQIDLREVLFIDSAGVTGLNRCRRHALRHDADVIVICHASSPVARLLDWTGLASVLDVRAISSV